MKHWILAAATLLLIQGADAREYRGPPPVCQKAKIERSPKPKCDPQPCAKPDANCPPVCFERGHQTDPCCTPSAYSEPAGIEVRCGYDTFITASFLYWEAIQGGMDLAIPAEATITGSSVASITQSAVGKSVLMQDTGYKPGFQVGLGWSGPKDDWALYAEYTWLHGSTHTSATAPNPGVATVGGIALPQNGIWNPSSWFANNNYTNFVNPSISATWKYKIDLVDAQISRPFYSGARYTVEPFFGLRGAWIRQHMSLSAPTLSFGGVPASGATRNADYSSVSRAVGPRIGMNGNWHLGYGIRFVGDAAASLLFTAYDVKQNVDSPDGVGGTSRFPLKTKIHDLNVLRPNLDLSLGLGWGSYFCCRKMHWDLVATYDFSIFWEQNMMRYLADLTAAAASVSPSGAAANLFLQGLTINTRFDF